MLGVVVEFVYCMVHQHPTSKGERNGTAQRREERNGKKYKCIKLNNFLCVNTLYVCNVQTHAKVNKIKKIKRMEIQ